MFPKIGVTRVPQNGCFFCGKPYSKWMFLDFGFFLPYFWFNTQVGTRTVASFARKSLTLRSLKVLPIWNQGHRSSIRPCGAWIRFTPPKNKVGQVWKQHLGKRWSFFSWVFLGPLTIGGNDGGRFSNLIWINAGQEDTSLVVTAQTFREEELGVLAFYCQDVSGWLT